MSAPIFTKHGASYFVEMKGTRRLMATSVLNPDVPIIMAIMRKPKTWITVIAVALLINLTAYPQASRTQPQTTQPQSMAKWAGKYPDAKFFSQPLIRTPLRRILSKADYNSIRYYNLMGQIQRVGDYLVTTSSVKYSDPLDSFSLAFSLKDGSVYIVFWEGEKHRKFSTRNNQFDLPDEVLKEMGLKEVTEGL